MFIGVPRVLGTRCGAPKKFTDRKRYENAKFRYICTVDDTGSSPKCARSNLGRSTANKGETAILYHSTRMDVMSVGETTVSHAIESRDWSVILQYIENKDPYQFF